MASGSTALEADWLGACRAAADALREILRSRPTTGERVEETGTRGEGGDRTLVIDEAAEEAVFGQLETLHRDGHRFTAVSEERGEVDFGDPSVVVVIDPIDGSLNAKRGVPAHALSIAVADGPTMADVQFGFVHDFGTGEEWRARRGSGALLNGRGLDPGLGERRDGDERLEIVGIESADPRWVAEAIDSLAPVAHRLRAVGAIAVSLCDVAAARFDGMVSLWNCRSVDAAAGQLIVREAGGLVAFPACDDPLGAPLDLRPRSPVVAARTERALRELTAVALRR
jgi:myo-inositol-1(or 4)-monophosphatase